MWLICKMMRLVAIFPIMRTGSTKYDLCNGHNWHNKTKEEGTGEIILTQ